MKLTDAQALTIAFSVVILLDLGFIALGYFHGNMHLIKTLHNAISG